MRQELDKALDDGLDSVFLKGTLPAAMGSAFGLEKRSIEFLEPLGESTQIYRVLKPFLKTRF